MSQRSTNEDSAVEVWLPWTDPRASIGLALDRGVDLCAGFWSHLKSRDGRRKRLQRARAHFAELDKSPSLDPIGLQDLNNTARLVALLEHLDGVRVVADSAWDEYLCRLSTGDPWLLRLAEALPMPDVDRAAFLGMKKGSVLEDFDRYLDEEEPLRAWAGARRFVIRIGEIAQLPFLYRFALYARERHPDVGIDVIDEGIAAPELFRLFGADFERVGVPMPKGRAARPKLSAMPGKSALTCVKTSDASLRVVWQPTVPGLCDGTSGKALAQHLRKVAGRGVPIALTVFLPLAPAKARAEEAIFAAFDALSTVQWSLASLRIGAVEEAPKGADFDRWFESWQRGSALGDLFQAQVQAELDNKALAPHKARYAQLDDAKVKLKTAPSTTVASRYPLDGLSDEDPPVMSWPYSYGRSCARVDVTVEAGPRKRRYDVCVGGRLIFSSPRDRKVLEYFKTPRSTKSFLSGVGKKLGVGISDLETLVVEGVLTVDREPSVRRKAGKRSGGFLHFVGIGPGGPESENPRVMEGIRAASDVWIQDLGHPGLERTSIRSYLGAQRIINTVDYYGTGYLRSLSRHRFYELAARRAIDLAGKGREITMVFSGSPVVWVHAWTVAREYLEEHPQLDLRVTNAMSFFESVFMPTPIGCIRDVQLRLGNLRNPDVSPDLDCILGQVGDTGQPHGVGSKPETIDETLSRLYPPDHPVYVVGNDEIDSEPLYLETTTSEVTSLLPAYSRWYLCLVIPSLKTAAKIRGIAESEKGRQRLSYLLG